MPASLTLLRAVGATGGQTFHMGATAPWRPLKPPLFVQVILYCYRFRQLSEFCFIRNEII